VRGAVRDNEGVPGPWSQSNVEKGACMLIPVPGESVGDRGSRRATVMTLAGRLTLCGSRVADPLGGVLIVGGQTLIYHNGSSYKAIPTQNNRICAYGMVDENG
jgi:hypothetical protein